MAAISWGKWMHHIFTGRTGELTMQKKLVAWLRAEYPQVVLVPTCGGSNIGYVEECPGVNKRFGNLLKLLGYQKGYPDFLFIVRPGLDSKDNLIVGFA